ncbi:MAG: hypothetical protein U0790_07010 [Isosphaeraceae bacterium]
MSDRPDAQVLAEMHPDPTSRWHPGDRAASQIERRLAASPLVEARPSST